MREASAWFTALPRAIPAASHTDSKDLLVLHDLEMILEFQIMDSREPGPQYLKLKGKKDPSLGIPKAVRTDAC